MPSVQRMSVRSRRAVLGAAAALAALPLLGCEITLGRQKTDGRGGPARRPPVRLGVSTGYLGDDLALEA